MTDASEKRRFRRARMNAAERASFAKRLSFLLRAGMPLPEALSLTGAEAPRSAASAIIALAGEVESGRPLSECAEAFPGLFSPFFIQAVRVGESSGTLGESFSYLADELQKGAALRSKLLGSLLYPLVVTMATIALTLGLVLFIFPKILPLFAGLDAALPLSTRIVLAVYGYLKRWGMATAALAAFAIAAGWYALHRFPSARRLIGRLALSLPVLGPLLRAYHLGNLARALSLLLGSGMALGEAVPAAARAAAHPSYRAELEQLSEHVEQGLGIAEFMRERSSFFPPFAVQLIKAGESSGALAESLAYIANFCENELEERTKQLSALVEPALMIGMGCIVGFVAVSMIAPVYEITQHLHGS